jgi:hypothetical protein
MPLGILHYAKAPGRQSRYHEARATQAPHRYVRALSPDTAARRHGQTLNASTGASGSIKGVWSHQGPWDLILLCEAPGRRAPIAKVSDSTRAAVAASGTPVFTATTAVATVKSYLYDKTDVSGQCSTEAQTGVRHPARGPLGRFKNSLESPRARESHTIGRQPPGAEAPAAEVSASPWAPAASPLRQKWESLMNYSIRTSGCKESDASLRVILRPRTTIHPNGYALKQAPAKFTRRAGPVQEQQCVNGSGPRPQKSHCTEVTKTLRRTLYSSVCTFYSRRAHTSRSNNGCVACT